MGKPTRQSVLDFGLPPPAAASPPLLVEDVDAAQGLLFYRAHGLALDAPIELRLIRDTTPGAPAPALPAGLAEGITYGADPLTASSFRLRLAGSPITSFPDAGTGRVAFFSDPGASIDIAIDRAWTLVMEHCTAHGGDVEAQIVTDAAGALAVRLYVAAMAAGDAAKAASYDGLAALWPETYRPLLDAYLAGRPVRGATDATPLISEGSPRFVRLGETAAAARQFGTCRSDLV